MAPPVCPAEEELKQYRLGLCSEMQAQQLEQHLQGCPGCLARLPAIPLDDPLVQGLRATRNRPRLRNPLLDHVQQEARALPVHCANVPVAVAVLVPGAGPSIDRRWLMLGGVGVLALVMLIFLIVKLFGSRPDPNPPPENGGAVEDDKPLARLNAKPRVSRSTKVDNPAPDKPLDPDFRETWVFKPDSLDGVKTWTIESSLVRTIAPLAFDFTDDERMLIRFSSGRWHQFDPKSCGFVPAPFEGLYDSLPGNAKLCARIGQGGVQLWEEGGNRAWTTLRSPGPGYQTALSPDGKTIVTLDTLPGGSSKELHFWETREGNKLADCSLPDGQFFSSALGWSPDSKTCAVGTGKGIALIRAPWRVADKIIPSPQQVHTLSWSPTGKYLATVEADRQVRTVEVSRPEIVESIPDFKVPSVSFVPAWSPDGKELAFATEDKKVIVWDWKAKQVTYSLSGHSRPITAVAFLGDGKTLVSASAGMRFWDLEKASLRGTLLTFIGAETMAISPEGYYRASVNTEGNFIFKAREESNRLREFSPDAFSKLYGWTNHPERVILSGE